MDGTLGAIPGPYLQENPSSMLINSPVLVVSESSAAHHHPYILPFEHQRPPTDSKLVGTLWTNIHDVCDTKKYLDSSLLDPQNLPNARDNGGIYCLTKLSKLKDGGKKFDRNTKEGKWVKSHSSNYVEAHVGSKIVLGIKTPFYYERKDEKRIDRWLMKQYTIHQNVWPLGKEKECEELGLCHIYLKHSSTNRRVHNGSSSSITSGAEPSKNNPELDYPQELPSSSILGKEQTDAGIGYPSNTVSNPSDHQNQHDDIDFTSCLRSPVSEGDIQFLENIFQNHHDDDEY